MADFALHDDPRLAALLDRQVRQGPGADVLGLDRIARLCAALGDPQRALPPVFHVAGTNGKGSTVAMLRAMLEAAGQRVHVFTSPHLVRFNERFRIAGRLIDDEALIALLGRVLDANETVGASFFEVCTAAAFLAFAETPADAAVVEVGLGGRLDATNILDTPLVTGIAALGLDHSDWLGDTLGAIAGEKAGIAKRGVPLVTLAYEPEAEAAIAARIAAVEADWQRRGTAWHAARTVDGFTYRDATGTLALPAPALPGPWQIDNAALAVAMLRAQAVLPVSAEAMSTGLRVVRWPARMQQLTGALAAALPDGSALLLDGGHNAQAAEQIAAALRAAPDQRPLVLIFASLASKDSAAVLAPFTGLAETVHCVPIPSHRCRPPAELVALAESLAILATAHPDLPAALASVAAPSRVLIFGSLYLAGEALRLDGSPPD